MIDIIALITAVGPIVIGLTTAVFNFVLYLKHKNLHANNNSSNQVSQSNDPR